MNKLYFILLLAAALPGISATAQFRQSEHKPVPDGVIAVSEPGSYDKAGATYMLTRNIESSATAVFLGKDVTLDLNGYTITYASGNYEHVINYGFEEDLKGWDVSKAPGAKIESTKVHAFIGDKILRLRTDDEIASSYVFLPVANRSYYAMCGVTGTYYNDMGGDLSNDMKVSIFVDDEAGREIECITTYGDTTMVSCPVLSRSTRLGGGFVFAHLNNLPAGRYRIRVRAENDCLVDEIDIRPALDAGIGIVGKTHPYGHYNHLYNRNHAAFFDYTEDVNTGAPFKGIPVATGTGTVTIKNGTIINGTTGVVSFGIQSTAEDVKVIPDNLKIISSGINTIAVDVPQATITNCSFDIKSPFIINRHGSEFYAVDLTGNKASEVSYCEFYGGQGCLSIKGMFSAIHHNHFINRQTVTNHYSIMAMGDGSKIFENLFEPEIGSGLEIFRHKDIEIFNNEFHMQASPPSCEYADHYSTNAIRIADYGAPLGSPTGSYGNRIYNNRFYLTGRKYKEYPDYIPMVSAVFFSTSAGDNDVFGNDIFINHKDPQSDAEAFAFYIGNARGGNIYNNTIVTNVTPIWVGSSYGKAENTIISGNRIVKAENTISDFTPVRMGSLEQPGFIATGTEFHSNEMDGLKFGIDKTPQHHSYSVFWTLNLKMTDKSGKVAAGTDVRILDKNREEVISRKVEDGFLSIELPEYTVDGDVTTLFSPYTIIAGKKKMIVDLNKNSSITLITK